MKHREYVYTGDPVLPIGEWDRGVLLHLQKAILLSLETRNLLTRVERELCERELEKQYFDAEADHEPI